MNMKDDTGLGLAITWLQQPLISACENNCPLRSVKVGRHSLKWTSELESLRKIIRRLFNKCRTDKDLQRWELYREAQRRYGKEVRKASKDARRTFCSSTKDLTMADRLHRVISSGPKIKLGSLVSLSDRRTQSEGDTLEFLLTTHFPNSELKEEMTTPAAALRARHSKWKVAAALLSYRTVEWAIDSFAHTKVQE